jgi:hypothetical protein
VRFRCPRLIVLTLETALPASLDFDDIIGDYLPVRGMSASPLKDTAAVPPVPSGKASGDWLDGLL